MARRPRPAPLRAAFPGQRIGAVPHNFQRLEIGQEQTSWLQEQALSIFTSMANAGHPFAACLAAIYLTGMHDAVETQKDLKEENPPC